MLHSNSSVAPLPVLYIEPEYESEEEPKEATGTISKRGKSSKRKQKDLTSSKSTVEESNTPSSVIYLGHLPTAFEERELLIFLNQFGPVSRCRVSRSTKTGRSRGYAFVEFDDADVARIVAEAMNGYFLLEKRLVCHVLPKDKVYDLMFKRPKKVMSKKDMQDKAREDCNKRKTPEVMKGITAKLIEREEAKRKKLKDLGIDYDFPGYAASVRGEEEKEKKSTKKKRKVSMDDKENSADETEENVVQEVKTPKAKKRAVKASTEVKKSKKKDKKRKSLT